MRSLNVWMNGALVGTWRLGRTGRHLFQYAPEWLRHPKSRPLSLSLPITANGQVEGPAVAHYFDNLLPDNDLIRQRIGTRHKTQGNDAFSLLAAIGRDCVGAVQLLPVDATVPDVHRLDYDAVTHEQINEMLAGLGTEMGSGVQDDDNAFRISIAGAQEKTALLQVNGQWCRPRNTTATTHILKPPIGITPGRNLDLTLSPENEWLCLQILRALGLAVCHCDVEQFGNRTALVVQRFDRQWQENPRRLLRIPQEDFCQVLGQPSKNKYEANGGPSLNDCLQVLKGSVDYERDGRTFLLAQLAFWLLAAIDGHAKNFSVFILPQGAYQLTPLYDVMSAWPIIETGPHALQYKKVKMAMAVRSNASHYRLAEILPRHWERLAQQSAIPSMWTAMTEMVAQVPHALETVAKQVPTHFSKELVDSIFTGVTKHANRFMAQQ